MLERPDAVGGRCFTVVAATLLAWWLCPAAVAAEDPARCTERAGDERWNVIVLLADDLGWNGLGCYGSDLHETPHLDRLAAEGVRFSDAYAACTVCSPTRAALMTGRAPARLHLTDWIPGQRRPDARLLVPDWTRYLDHEQVTVAEAFRDRGYRAAHIGKWHLGGPDHLPETHGFDLNVAGDERGSPAGGYFLPNRMVLPGAVEGQYLTDYLTDRAVAFLHESVEIPFLLYLPYFVVHTPIQAPPETTRYFADRVDPNGVHRNAEYAAMTTALDRSVGRIRATLDSLALADRTVILFTSDNGGLTHRFGRETGITDNAPLRRGKGSAYEGGLRVPLIIYHPGLDIRGECREPVITMDVCATALELAGSDASTALDGRSLLPLLRNPEGALEREALFWHYPHYHAGGDALEHEPSQGPFSAVRRGDWKLIEYLETGRVELYHLARDPSESMDLADVHPERASRLRQYMAAWREEVNAQMPSVNPSGGSRRPGRSRPP